GDTEDGGGGYYASDGCEDAAGAGNYRAISRARCGEAGGTEFSARVSESGGAGGDTGDSAEAGSGRRTCDAAKIGCGCGGDDAAAFRCIGEVVENIGCVGAGALGFGGGAGDEAGWV